VTRTARVIVEPRWYNGTPAEAAPRYRARQLLDRLQDMGFGVRSGFEYEVYLTDADTRRPVFDGIQIFWTLRNNWDPAFMLDVLDNMEEAGVDIITANAEYGPGQLEINYAPDTGIQAADTAFTFKNGLKEMAQQYGYLASFMTKPYADQSASGCHYHHSLFHLVSGENAFYDSGTSDGLSGLARFWIGGQIAHAGAVSALCAPTVNCAKRFKLFSFAPMNATWGHEDRTVALRVKGGREADTHLENRIPGAGSNPYLVMAAVLAAGIDGLIKRIEPPSPEKQIAYLNQDAAPLPVTLDDALHALEADTTLGEYLGAEFIQLFLAVKRHEIARARAALPEYEAAEWPHTVTDWERENLFEYL
jgi:glutamine synthetase